MPASIAEHFHEQVGTPINHLRLLTEIRHRVHHAKQFDHLLDAAEFTQLFFQNPEFGYCLLKLITARLIENAQPGEG